jgi:hypothetical protein
VEISAALAADLKSLTDALDQPGTDLEALLRGLADDSRRAVHSFLGLTMTLIVEGYPVTLTAMDEFTEDGDIASSMLLPLPALSNAEQGSLIVFYASRAGAFVDFAADLSFALRLELDALALDEHLTLPVGELGLAGLADMTDVNQAIGILIARGDTPAGARTELHRRAHLAEITVRDAALLLIHETGWRFPAEQA